MKAVVLDAWGQSPVVRDVDEAVRVPRDQLVEDGQDVVRLRPRHALPVHHVLEKQVPRLAEREREGGPTNRGGLRHGVSIRARFCE